MLSGWHLQRGPDRVSLKIRPRRKLCKDPHVAHVCRDVIKGSSDGDATAATFHRPVALAIHPSKNYAIVVDQGNNRIRRVMLDTGDASVLH